MRNVILGLPIRAAGESETDDRLATGIPGPEELSVSAGASAPPAQPRIRWVLVSSMPLARASGSGPARMVTTLADVTEQRRALDVVRGSEEKYRGLIEALPLMVIQFDRTMRITYVNPATLRISGYDLADLQEVGAWQTLIHPEDLPKLLELLPETLAGMTSRAEARYRAKDGSEKFGYIMTQPRWLDSEIVGGVSLILDLTRERRLESDLLRAQRQELVGRLASGIAHDFNNLLTVVLTLAELAKEHLPGEHPVREDLRRIGDAAGQAATLAGQLLKLSSQRRVGTRVVEVNAVARRTLELLGRTLPATVQVRTDLEEGNLSVLVDEIQVQQVLMNLCLNARDAMPAGGRIFVQTRSKTAAAEEGDWVRLSVRDEGQGMANPVKERIFDPFFSTKERGTGLGLAVVRQIVESHNGRVEVWSEPGEGSRFDVWLPRALAN